MGAARLEKRWTKQIAWGLEEQPLAAVEVGIDQGSLRPRERVVGHTQYSRFQEVFVQSHWANQRAPARMLVSLRSNMGACTQTT